MFSGSIHTGKRFFMQKTLQTMSGSYLFQAFHNQLIMIERNIGLFINHSQLMLGRCNLIMFRLYRYPEAPKFLIQVPHKFSYSLSNNAVVMIIELLTLCRHTAEKCSSGVNQVLPFQVFFPIYKKILLFRPYRGLYIATSGIAEQA